jgi:hypothetical protein
MVEAPDGATREPRPRLLVLADRLFAADEPPSRPGRWWLARYLGVTLLLATIVALRRIDAITIPQFWAEDG